MKILFQKVHLFIKTEKVLFVSGSIAILSMLMVPPSTHYVAYLDFRVLSLLFCLMTVVAGFHEIGVFLLLSETLLKKVTNTRSLSFVLIMLCFFTSMWITNDVALITFVPFAIMVLTMTKQSKHILFVVVLQTIAANLGSMLTPIGNPQNLFLYSYYNVPMNEFLRITFPITTISFVLLCITVLLIKKETLYIGFLEQRKSDYHEFVHCKKEKQKNYFIAMYSALFLLCLSCVLRFIDYRITLFIVFLCIIRFHRSVLKKVDYSLLLTFVCFFVFVGNIGNIAVVKEFLVGLLEDKGLPVAILTSQVISNVPAAVLLSTFTKDYNALILGTNIGGLGTLVASLASLISYKFYCKTEGAKPGKYLGIFTFYNIIFLVALCLYNWTARYLLH